MLRRCRSRFIVNFIGVVSDPPRGQIMVVTERMMGGDLWHALRRGEVAWAERGWRLAMDIASGLAYLSTRRIVHNDLKSSNILLDGEGRAKISDVGLARIIPDSRSYLPSRSGESGMGRGDWEEWTHSVMIMIQRCVGEGGSACSWLTLEWNAGAGECVCPAASLGHEPALELVASRPRPSPPLHSPSTPAHHTAAEGGSFQWCAPEAILGEPSTVQSDMYSYGEQRWSAWITGVVCKQGGRNPGL